MLNGVILQKLQTLEQVMMELISLGKISAQQLQEDWQIRRAIERSLQVALEVMMDVCQRILAVQGQTPAATGSETIARCVERGVLFAAEPYRRMVQFRNFIVHRYEQVDVEILVDIVNNRLNDFDRFRREVLQYVRAH